MLLQWEELPAKHLPCIGHHRGNAHKRLHPRFLSCKICFAKDISNDVPLWHFFNSTGVKGHVAIFQVFDTESLVWHRGVLSFQIEA